MTILVLQVIAIRRQIICGSWVRDRKANLA
jgi:hypothetical protein